MVAGVLTTALAFVSSVTATYAWFYTESSQIDQLMTFSLADQERILEMGYYDASGVPHFGDEENPLRFDEAGLRNYFADSGYDPSKPLDPVTGLSSIVSEGKPVLTPAYRAGRDPKTFLITHDDGTTTRPSEIGTYYQFEFAFKCTADCWLYLSPESHVSPGDNTNKFDAETGLALSEEKLNKAVHALRVRFTGLDADGNVTGDYWSVPTVTPSKEGQNLTRDEGKGIDDVYYGGVANLSASNGYYDYRDGEEVVYGQIGDEKIFKEERGDGVAVTDGDFLTAGHAKDVKVVDVEAMKKDGRIEKEDAKPFSSLTLENDDEGNPVGQTSSDILLSLKANTPQKLVVTIYIEGWDPYCTNDIGQAAMSLDLVFTGLVH